MSADHYVMDTDLKAVADAIRTKGGTAEPLVFPDGFVTAIGNIQTGGGGEIPAPRTWSLADFTLTKDLVGGQPTYVHIKINPEHRQFFTVGDTLDIMITDRNYLDRHNSDIIMLSADIPGITAEISGRYSPWIHGTITGLPPVTEYYKFHSHRPGQPGVTPPVDADSYVYTLERNDGTAVHVVQITEP